MAMDLLTAETILRLVRLVGAGDGAWTMGTLVATQSRAGIGTGRQVAGRRVVTAWVQSLGWPFAAAVTVAAVVAVAAVAAVAVAVAVAVAEAVEDRLKEGRWLAVGGCFRQQENRTTVVAVH
jgi:hypothetical protein